MESEDNNSILNFTDKNQDPSEKNRLPVSIEKSINNVIKKEGYTTYNVNIQKITPAGGNYFGIIREIDVKGKTNEGDKETNIFVKQIIPGDQMKFISIAECYENESYFYNELIQIYEELQNSAGIPEKERFKVVKSFNESNAEAIILENVSRKGFKTVDRMEVISLLFAKLSVEQLARFHGLSMVLEKQRPDYFEKKLKILKVPNKLNDHFDSFVQTTCQYACKDLTFDSKKKVEKLFDGFVERFKKHWDPSRVGCCVCHGDYKANNLMYREVDGAIAEVIPIDFQLLHYGCPLNDFVCFIFVATDREFRRNHMENLKELYYETLKRFLEYFDMDLNLLYPRMEFERQYKEALEYGLLLSMYVVPFIFTLESDAPDLGTAKLKDTGFKLDDRYKERMQGIVDDFIQWGYI